MKWKDIFLRTAKIKKEQRTKENALRKSTLRWLFEASMQMKLTQE